MPLPTNLSRRRMLASLLATLPTGAVTAGSSGTRHATSDYPAVIADVARSFPRDFGAHPDYRTEWWYLTAWLDTDDGPMGLQLTFFRSRTPYGRDNPSRLAARQLYFAHAAIAAPSKGRLIHAEQAWRGGTAIATASEQDTGLQLGRPQRQWSLRRRPDDRYVAAVADPSFNFELEAVPSLAVPVLQGEKGYSRKGLRAEQASYYYSRPQLDVTGSLSLKAGTQLASPAWSGRFTGTGWLDHEWSSELLDPQARGWDWIGINLSDGRALMAFQMRADNGGVLHATARLIGRDGSHRDLPIEFTPQTHWVSPRTGTRYPIVWRIRAGEFDWRLEPLIADQELDSRRSTGMIYWEGAVQVSAWTSKQNPGQSVIGRGYLEMTGYAAKMRL